MIFAPLCYIKIYLSEPVIVLNRLTQTLQLLLFHPEQNVPIRVQTSLHTLRQLVFLSQLPYLFNFILKSLILLS